MNGGADLGGMHGFGPVVDDPDEPHFHAGWEPRVMAMVVALGACGQWNIDQSRFARESLSPPDYMRWPYYRIWLEAAEKMLLKADMIAKNELGETKSLTPAIPVKGTMEPENVWAKLHSLAGSAERPGSTSAAFAVGDNIRTINNHPAGHTRLPRYARGHNGVVTKVLGHHVFPDSSGNDLGDDPRWLYQVRFLAQELWGEQANPRDSVTLDLWEPHLRSMS
ncbi:MAG: nitrile hydratase subunit beta [Pseudomonadota bacterium]